MGKTKRTFINIGSGIVFTVLIFLAILHSSLCQMYIGKYLFSLVSKELKVEAYCGDFSFNIFTKRVKIQELYISDIYYKPMLNMEKLSLAVQSFSSSHLSVNTLTLDNLKFILSIHKQDSISNFRYVLNYIETLQGDGGGGAFDVNIFDVHLNNGYFSFQDERVHPDNPHVIDMDDIAIQNVNIDANNLLILGRDIFAQINQISFKEKSGFEVKSFASIFYISPDSMVAKKVKVKTNQSNLNLDLKFETSDWSSYSNFYSDVKMLASVQNTSINMNDLAFFSENIKGMKNQFKFSAHVDGTVDHMNATKVALHTGVSTLFMGDVGMKGLPDFYQTEFDLNITKLQTSYSDISQFYLPQEKKIALPDVLQRLNSLELQGKFLGRYEHFQTELGIKSNLGELALTFELRDQDLGGYFINGGVQSSSFNIGKLFSEEKWLGDSKFNLEIQGLGPNFKDMNFHLLGKVFAMDFNGEQIKNIDVDGEVHTGYFQGHLNIDDEDVDLSFRGLLDFEEVIPIANFSANIRTLNLSHYGIIKDSLPFILKAKIDANYSGAKLDDMSGTIKIQDFHLLNGAKNFSMKEMEIYTGSAGTHHEKIMRVSSNLVDVNIAGVYYFDKIPNVIVNVFQKFIPKIQRTDPFQNIIGTSLMIAQDKTPPQENSKDSLYQNFNLEIKLKNANPLLDIFVPGLQISDNTSVQITYSSENEGGFKMDFSSPFIDCFGVALDQVNLKGETKDKQFLLSGKINKVALGDSVSLRNFYFLSDFYGRDTILWNMGWNNHKIDEKNIFANIKGIFDFSHSDFVLCEVFPSNLQFAKEIWSIEQNCKLAIANSYLSFSNFGLKALNSDVSVMLDGEISKSPESEVYAKLSNFELSYFDFFFQQIGMDIQGKLSGVVKINNFYGNLALNSNINIGDFKINETQLGDAHFFTSFNTALKGIYTRFEIDNFESKMLTPILLAEGYYYPIQKKNQYNFEIACSALPLSILQGYFDSFASNLSGTATGKLIFTGEGDRPYFEGGLSVDKMKMHIDELHVDYIIDQTQIDLSSESIRFKKVPIKDSLYNTLAFLNGEIKHDNFYDFNMQMRIDFENFLLLNSKDKSLLYNGQLFGSGFAELSGPFEDIKISVSVKTDKNTKVDFNLASQMNFAETSFIVFRSASKDSSKVNVHTAERKTLTSPSKLTLNLNITATPEALFGINIKDAKMEGQLYSKGNGDLRFIYNAQGQTFLYGTYLVSDGTFDFSMQDLLTKTFKINNGGSISWTGDLMDAKVNIKAVYPLKTSLTPILGEYAKQGGDLTRKVNVESEIGIHGNLLNPQLGFDIKLLNVSDDTRDKFSTLVNKENESEMIKQTFSLLVLNSFMPVGGNDLMPSLTNSVFVSSSEILFSQFNSVLSKLSNDFDFGLNYTPESDLNNSEFQVMMSGQMFDNRLTIDGNFGVGGDAKAATVAPTGASNITGDINVEYMVTDKLRLKAFNRSNERDLLKPESSYTFGVGVLYRRDFDTFYEFLFPKKNKLSVKDSLPLSNSDTTNN